MTTIGKLLVFVNLVASVGLMAWALSLFTNRIDWLDTTAADVKVEGQISLLKKEIDRLKKAIGETQAGYSGKKYALGVSEERLDQRDRVFKARLGQARNGRFKVQIAEDKGAFGEGVIYDITREGADILGPDNKPLRGLKTLQDEFAAEVRTIEILQVGEGVLSEDPQWKAIRGGTTTLAQVGELTPKLGIADLRRLHVVLSDLITRDEVAIGRQKRVEKNLTDEAAYLGDKRVNWVAELQSLQRRERQLTGRLQSVSGKAPGL